MAANPGILEGRFVRLFGCTCGAAILLLAVDGQAAQPSELREFVLQAIDANNSQITSYHAKLVHHLVTHGIDEPTSQVIKGEGRMIEVTRIPSSARSWEIWCDGQLLRSQSVGPSGKQYVQVFDGESWRSHIEATKSAKVFAPDDASPDIFDLRQCGTPFRGRTLVGFLREAKLLSGELQGDVVKLQLADGRDGLVTVRCASSDNFLPSAVSYADRRGVVIGKMSLTYRPVLEGAARLLSELMAQSYGKEGELEGTSRYEIRECEVNPAIEPAVFTLDLPDGTRVVDFVSRSSRVVGEPDPTSSRPGAMWMLSLGAIAALSGYVVFVVFRRRR